MYKTKILSIIAPTKTYNVYAAMAKDVKLRDKAIHLYKKRHAISKIKHGACFEITTFFQHVTASEKYHTLIFNGLEYDFLGYVLFSICAP